MTYFIVEHNHNGRYTMETIAGVEDIDISSYKEILGLWVCDSDEERDVIENKVKEMRNARSGQPS
jgi:hypothetical protein